MRRRCTRLALVLLAWLVALPAGVAAAHERSLSYSEVDLRPDGARLRARVTRLDLSRLPIDPFATGSEDAGARYVAGRLQLRRGGRPCPPDGPVRALAAPAGWAVYEWNVTCPAEGEVELTSELFAAVAPSHLHFARAAAPGGAVRERVLADEARTWRIEREADASGDAGGSSFLDYVALGVEHIVSGWDHLAFVVALLLLAESLREVATLVTAFTLAHSLTLAAATLGLVRANGPSVEALIGFSIALVAAENAWLIGGRDRTVPRAVAVLVAVCLVLSVAEIGHLGSITLAGLGLFAVCHFALLDRASRPARLRAAVAFGFGLLHGFGFAGLLAEMELPSARLLPALLGFNLGVEAGQLAVVAAVWPMLRALERVRGGAVRRIVGELGSAAICGLGLYWFVTRSFG